MITPQNVLRHELIGLAVEVIASTNPGYCGIRGTIINETKNLLMVRTDAGIKNVAKSSCTFRLALPGGTVVEIRGSALIGRPEKRITMKLRR